MTPSDGAAGSMASGSENRRGLVVCPVKRSLGKYGSCPSVSEENSLRLRVRSEGTDFGFIKVSAVHSWADSCVWQAFMASCTHYIRPGSGEPSPALKF